MIAYGFPPDGSAGVYRPLRFVRYLPDEGWHPTVIAAKKSQYGRYDPGLLAMVPEQVEVVRISGEDIWQRFQAWRASAALKKSPIILPKHKGEIQEVQSSSIRSFLRNVVRWCEGWYYHPDLAMPWIKSAVTATVNVYQRTHAKVIWATGGPWSSFVVAKKVSSCIGIPYVLDFRDSWTLAPPPFEATRPEWAKRLDKRLLFQLLQGAQAVTFRYHSEAECYWRAYPGALEASRVHIIPNGFDGTIEEYNPTAGTQDKCVVLYAGTLTPYRYDTLLEGVRLLKESSPGLAKNLQILFVGDGMEMLTRAAEKLSVLDIINTRGTVSYSEICCLQREANALLLLGLIPTKGHELCGSKVFSYFKAGRPIIGILPHDEMRNVLSRVGASTIADIDSPAEISAVFRQLLEAWLEDTLSELVPNRKSCEVYSAKQQTSALVRALQGSLPSEPFVPGSVDIPPSLQEDIRGVG